MKTYVLDASVALAWYLPETFSQEARRWRDHCLEGEARFIAPGLHYWEVANVLRTYTRRGELTEVLAHEIYGLHRKAPISIVEPSADKVLKIAFQYGASVYDAVYITVALENQATLLTGERTTSPWVVKLGKVARPLRES